MRSKERNGKGVDQKETQSTNGASPRRRKRPKRGRHLPRHRLPQKAVVRIPLKPQEVRP